MIINNFIFSVQAIADQSSILPETRSLLHQRVLLGLSAVVHCKKVRFFIGLNFPKVEFDSYFSKY